MEPVVTEYTFFLDKPLYRIETGEDGFSGICLLTDRLNVVLRDTEKDLWAVVYGGSVVNSDCKLELEPSPSNRDDDFLRRARCLKHAALMRAKKFIALHKEYCQPAASEELRQVREAIKDGRS